MKKIPNRIWAKKDTNHCTASSLLPQVSIFIIFYSNLCLLKVFVFFKARIAYFSYCFWFCLRSYGLFLYLVYNLAALSPVKICLLSLNFLNWIRFDLLAFLEVKAYDLNSTSLFETYGVSRQQVTVFLNRKRLNSIDPKTFVNSIVEIKELHLEYNQLSTIENGTFKLKF